MSTIPDTGNRVAVIGCGRVGSTLAQRIVEKNLADVVLLDLVKGLPQGLALDLLEAQGIERHDCQIIGTSDYVETAGSATPNNLLTLFLEVGLSGLQPIFAPLAPQFWREPKFKVPQFWGFRGHPRIYARGYYHP